MRRVQRAPAVARRRPMDVRTTPRLRARDIRDLGAQGALVPPDLRAHGSAGQARAELHVPAGRDARRQLDAVRQREPGDHRGGARRARPRRSPAPSRVAAEDALARGDADALAALGRNGHRRPATSSGWRSSTARALLSSSWRDGDPTRLHAPAAPQPARQPGRDPPGPQPRRRRARPLPRGHRARPPAPPGRTAAGRRPRRRVRHGLPVAGEQRLRGSASRRRSSILIGAVSVLVSLPLVYLLVHRIFHPIRQLVDATNRIAAGDLDAQVAIHRPDVIGDARPLVQRDGQAASASSSRTLETPTRAGRPTTSSAEANEQLAEANRDLEQKVRQRTGAARGRQQAAAAARSRRRKTSSAPSRTTSTRRCATSPAWRRCC